MMNVSPAISNRKIHIAIIGCGRISKNHIKSIISESAKVDLVALCDVNLDRLESAQSVVDECAEENHHPPSTPVHYSSYNELLAEVKSKKIRVDLIILTTPSGMHPSQTISAASVGIHVCTEKPMATKWADGLAMVKACDDAGVCLFVVKQNRFNTTLQLVKRQLKAGRFGRLAMVSVNVFWQRPQSYYDQDSWRGTWEFDGGALMNQASHYIDLLDWLIGPVQSVSASIATLGRDIDTEDTAAMQLRWRNGALGTMAVTMLAYPTNLEGSITILGDSGSVKIGGKAVNQIEMWEFADDHEDDQLVEKASYETSSVYGFGHPLYYEDMINFLQGSQSKSMCDGRSGLHSLELLIAAYRSARDLRTCNLPLEL